MSEHGDIRVMIVDDHQMVREGLKVLLSTCDDIAVVGEAADGAEAVDLCPVVRPDVVLMDVMMPVMDGAVATAEITAAYPAVRVIALTSFVDQDYVQKTIDAGAISYLLKDARPEALTRAIRDAMDGRGTIDSSAMKALLERRDDRVGRDLTAREREVLALLADGLSNKEIAERADAQRGHRPAAREQRPLQARRPQPHHRRSHRHEARAQLSHLSHLSGSR